ncbi:MAG: hypothetical protein HN348_00770 [Proteobacteria bacterium]|jgi:hypothetical protein|nr:hypothetical protein [Pseudomonadota bacterium]
MAQPQSLWRRSRWFRRIFILLTVLFTMGVIAVPIFWYWLRSPIGNAWIQYTLINRVNGILFEGSLDIGDLHTDLWSSLSLSDVLLLDGEGNTVIGIETLSVEFNARHLLARRVQLDKATIKGLVLDLDVDEEGFLNLARIFGGTEPAPESPEPWGGLPVTIVGEQVLIDGASVSYGDSLQFVGMTAKLTLHGEGTRIEANEIGLAATLRKPVITPVLAEGMVAYTGDSLELNGLQLYLPLNKLSVDGGIALGETTALEMSIDLEEMNLLGLDPLAAGAGLQGHYAGKLNLVGPLNELTLSGELHGTQETTGQLHLDSQFDLSAPEIAWTADLGLADFHVEQALSSIGDTVALDGTLALGGHGVAWPDNMTIEGTFTGTKAQEIYGIDLKDVNSNFQIIGGRLVLTELGLNGVVGNLRTVGDVDLVGGPVDLRVTGTLDPSQLEQLGVSGVGGGGNLSARITGDIKDSNVPFVADGEATLAPFSYQDNISFERVFATYHAEVAGADVTGNAVVFAYAGDTYGASIEEVHARRVDFSLIGGDVELDGEAGVTNITYGEHGGVEATEITFDLSMPKEQSMSLEAVATIETFQAHGLGGDTGQILAKMENDRIDFDVDLRAGEREWLGTAGQFALDTTTVSLDYLRLAPTPRIFWEDDGPQRLTILSDGLANTHLALAGPLGAFSFDGELSMTGTIDGRLAVSDFQLDTLAELDPVRLGNLSGVVNMGLQMDGTGKSPRFEGNLQANRLWVEGVTRWLDVSGTISGSGGTIQTDLAIGTAGAPTATIVGSIPVRMDMSDPAINPEGQIDLAVALMPGTLQRLEQLSPKVPELPKGQISAVVDLSGSMGNPDIAVAGIAELAVRGWNEPGRTEFHLERTGADITWWADFREGLVQRGTAGGYNQTRMSEIFAWLLDNGPEPDLNDYTLYADNLMVNTVLLGVPIASLTKAMNLDLGVHGDLIGGMTAYGSPYSPQVEGGFHWLDAKIGGQDLDGAYASLIPAEEGYSIELQLSFPEEGSLSVTGDIPLLVDLKEDRQTWQRSDMALEISGEGIPIAMITAFDDGVESPKGLLRIEGDVGGILWNPDAHVNATIEDASLIYAPMGIRAHQVALDLSVQGREVTLGGLSAHTSPIGFDLLHLQDAARPSMIIVTGKANIEEGVPTVEAQVTVNDAYMAATPELLVRLNGGLKMEGAWPQLEVKGNPGLELVQGRVVLDAASFLQVGSLNLDPAVVVHRSESVELAQREEKASFFDEMEVNFPISLNRNLSVEVVMPFVEDLGAIGAAVTSMVLNARIGSGSTKKLVVNAKNGTPELTGEVEVIEGKVSVLQSRFDLTQGTVSFIGDDIANPNFDIQGQMAVTGATVDMQLSGTPKDPQIEFNSQEYPGQTQILTILITGAAPDELNANQGQAAATALAGMLFNSVFSGVQLGSFSIEPDGSVTVGLPISSNLYAESSFSPTADIQENTVAAELEWTIAPRLVLSGGAGNRIKWADLFWEIRF